MRGTGRFGVASPALRIRRPVGRLSRSRRLILVVLRMPVFGPVRLQAWGGVYAPACVGPSSRSPFSGMANKPER